MIQTNTNQNFLDSQHKRVLNRIGTEYPTKKWILLTRKYVSNILSIAFLLLSTVVFVWFINNLIRNEPFLRPSLVDISGVEWIWSPELLGLAVLLYFIGISLQKSLNTSFLKLSGLGIVMVFAIFINIALSSPATFAFQTNIQPQFNSLAYRQFSRDNHIKILLDKDIYYGIIVEQTSKSVSINHGGIIKTFVVRQHIPNIDKNSVQITFDKNLNVLGYTILDSETK